MGTAGYAIATPVEREANAIERATYQYVTGDIEIVEFERRVEYALADFPHKGGTVIC